MLSVHRSSDIYVSASIGEGNFIDFVAANTTGVTKGLGCGFAKGIAFQFVDMAPVHPIVDAFHLGVMNVRSKFVIAFQVLSVEGVLSFRDEHFWRHSSNVVCGTIHIQIKPEVSEQKVIAQVS